MADDDRPYHERYRRPPPPEYLRYLTAPFTGYWKRQGDLAREGLAMADEGAQRVRGGDLSGYLGMLLGPVGYVSSPINALFPTDAEVYDAPDLPDWLKPTIAGAVGTAAVVAPGPKTRGLGRGMKSLADDATDAERAALAARLEAEAAQTGGAANATGRDQALRNLTEAPPEGITAYHGSPHTFDRFDMSKIGTGEGAQAYGHGLYFAENESVARGYRDILSQDAARADIDGNAKFLVQKFGGDEDYAKTVLRDQIENGDHVRADTKGRLEATLQSIETGRYKGGQEPAGSMYQVRINAKPEEFLDWDRPLSEQPRALQDAYGEVFPRHDPRRSLSDKGVTITPALAENLRSKGVKGIRYLDAGSRAAKGGTYNYVVFDDKIIDILKRYGIPITAGAGGAAIVSGEDMPPELAAQMGSGA